MVKLLECYEKSNADTTAYLSLRNYYLGLSAQNHSDTAFARVARELAVKVFVRLGQVPRAIDGYENIISNSAESLEILCSELNIIETYLLLQQSGGNAPGFTGKLINLKPENTKDAMKMIYNLVFNFIALKRQN